LTLLLASLSGLASAVLGLVLGVALAVLPGKPRLLLVALLGVGLLALLWPIGRLATRWCYADQLAA
ncbi:hypothetical protein KQ767_16170, partial [Listeria monocytogenes]|nr:hypothetical protein [Listeria monocytogenes]